MENLKSVAKKTKAVIYCRVSSPEQEITGYSLPAQEKFLREYAERPENNYEVVQVFRVSESAAGKIKRKIFQEMMDYTIKNKISVVIVETTNRLTRNFADVITIDAWIMANEENRIHLTKEGCILHKNSKSHEWFMWRMKVATAEYYVKLLSENVKKGQKEKIAQGWLPTTPPLGYKTIGEKGHKIIVKDKNVARYIVKMFELYSTGNYSTKTLADEMYKRGLRSRNGCKVPKSQIHRDLLDVFYIGKMVWNGIEYQGKHEPLISVDLFRKIRAMILRGTPYNNKHDKELRGKVFCKVCGKTVTWEKQKGHWYGACKQCKAQLDAKKKYIRQEDLEDKLMPHFDNIAPKGEHVLEVLKKALKESHSKEMVYHETQVQSINNSLQRTQQRLDIMYNDRLDGRIKPEEYDAKFILFNKEKEGLLEALGKLKSDNSEYYKVGIAIHELASRAKEIYLSEKATTEDRKLLLAYAFSKIFVSKGIITPEYTKAFNFLTKWMPKVNKVLEPKQKAAETYISDGVLPKITTDFSLELSEVQNNSRTSKKSPVKPRQEVFTSLSRPLLPN